MADTTKTSKTNPPAVLRCTCKHEFQDKTYGAGMRLHNSTRKNDGTVYRCTICGAERSKTINTKA